MGVGHEAQGHDGRMIFSSLFLLYVLNKINIDRYIYLLDLPFVISRN